MFSHVLIGSKNLAKSKVFYDAIFEILGIPAGTIDEVKGRCLYISEQGIFGFVTPIDGKPATSANGGTIGFSADSEETVNAWHAAGVAAGGDTCEDPPGPRQTDGQNIYVAYLRDPDGNKLCAIKWQ